MISTEREEGEFVSLHPGAEFLAVRTLKLVNCTGLLKCSIREQSTLKDN